jgi:indole-3-glycerol phosphate synthase
MTLAQAYLKTSDPLSVLTDEVFFKTSVAPIPEIWTLPA